MPSRRPVSWWNEQCTIANREKKTALRRYQRSRLMVDKIAYSRARSKARFVKPTAKKASWQDYVSSINDNTHAKKCGNSSIKSEGNMCKTQFRACKIMETWLTILKMSQIRWQITTTQSIVMTDMTSYSCL